MGAASGVLILRTESPFLFSILCALVAVLFSWRVRIWFMLPYFCVICVSTSQRIPYIPVSDASRAIRDTVLVTGWEQRHGRTWVHIRGSRYGTVLLLPNTQLSTPIPGTIISAQFHWEPWNTGFRIPQTFQEREWRKKMGISGKATLLHWQTLSAPKGWHYRLHQVQQFVRSHLQNHAPRSSAGFLIALLLGERGDLDREILRDFRNTGLIHILAVSGFHVVLISEIILILLNALRLPHVACRILASLILIAYIPLVGATPSVLRAVLMFLFEQYALNAQRDSNGFHRLGLAITVILIVRPNALEDLGFHLSCAATAGILATRDLSASFSDFHPLLKKITDSLCATLGASCASLPILINAYQGFSPIPWIGNLLIVPLIALAMYGGLFSILFSPIPVAAHGYATAASFLLQISQILTARLGELPGAQISAGPWPLPVMALILFAGLLLPHALCKGARSRSWVWIAMAAGFWGSWRCAAFLKQEILPDAEIYILDAGQGDCAVLRINGKVLVIDAGNSSRQGQYGEREIVPFLRRAGIHRIHALIVTHPDADHFGGAQSLMRSYPVDGFWFTKTAFICDKKDWQNLLREASRLQIPMNDLCSGQIISGLGPWRLDALYPLCRTEAPLRDWNNVSLVMRLSYDKTGVLLLTGDLSHNGESDILRLYPGGPRASILKLGHHGSHTSNSRPWLESVQARIALISAGRDNRYEHPDPRILARLDSLGMRALNTATHGSLRVRLFPQSRYISQEICAWDNNWSCFTNRQELLP